VTGFSTAAIAPAINMIVRPSSQSGTVTGSIHVETVSAGANFDIAFSGSASTQRYIADMDQIVADTYNVVLAVLQTALVPQSIVALHAAFFDLNGAGVLVAGPSGAGKTSLAVAALQAGCSVFSSEITFVSEGLVRLGESSLIIGTGAVAKFGFDMRKTTTERRGSNWVMGLPLLSEARKIDLVVFPRVGLVPQGRRRLPRKGAEVQAFECAASQASLWRVVGDRTELVHVPWDAASSVATIAQAFRICQEPAWVIEGSPQDVMNSISEILSGTAG
jgi:hypothetical protein